jgi:hypothetical protein
MRLTGSQSANICQPGNNPKTVLYSPPGSMASPTRAPYVIAQESGASILWAFRVTDAGRLLSAHGSLVIALENEESKAKASDATEPRHVRG